MFNISEKTREEIERTAKYTILVFAGAFFAMFGTWFARLHAMNTATSLLQVVMVVVSIGYAALCFYAGLKELRGEY